MANTCYYANASPKLEARALHKLVKLGLLTVDEGRILISIPPAQREELERVFGEPAAGKAVAYRTQVLREFERLQKNGNGKQR